MAATPRAPKLRSKPFSYPDLGSLPPQPSTPIPSTPHEGTPRRSTRQKISFEVDIRSLEKSIPNATDHSERKAKRKLSTTPKSPSVAPASPTPKKRIPDAADLSEGKAKRKLPTTPKSPSFAPASPDPPERKRQRKNKSSEPKSPAPKKDAKKKVYYKKVVYDGGDFEIGDDAYINRKEDMDIDLGSMDPVCGICFKAGSAVMIECDDCLGGFHLKCLRPPLRKVPNGDWYCGVCTDRKLGNAVELPKPPEGKQRRRSASQMLLSGELWVARIERLWKEPDGTYWANVCWYLIPEETAAGRQNHNLKRELYRTNHYDDIEMECILRHCYVMNPKEFAKADEGEDIFFCEYEYDIQWHSFKRIADIDDIENDEIAETDKDWIVDDSSDSDAEDVEQGKESRTTSVQNHAKQDCAANTHKGRIFGLKKVGIKVIPEHVRCHKQTDLERAKSTLLLSTLPKAMPCRKKEMVEISAFVKGAICEDQCLGRCLYIHGVPGTGKTMSVLSVMRSLKSEVDDGTLTDFTLIEINCLKLASPENIYKVIYEGLSGHRVGWKKALHMLNERFSGISCVKKNDKPCILLIDELDLLVTRSQSVLYNILDWPTKAHSKLVIIGIANTMDLPEKLLPRISSRMGIQRLCFGPYNYQELQEIINARLNGINAFEKQAIEFASRKVAAISGDARRALEVCRRAAELADYRLMQSKSRDTSKSVSSWGKCIVDMADVEGAIQEMFQAPHIQVMRTCSRLSKIILAAMVYELHKCGLGEITFDKLAMSVSRICPGNGETSPGRDTISRVCCKLGECRIIHCEEAAKHRLQKLQLNFPSDDVAFALKNCEEVPWLAKYL